MQIVIKTDLRAFTKGMRDIAKRQLPFAMAQALTATAGRAGLEWQDEMRQRLDRPTPFTINAVAVRGARKSNLTATVYIKDIASQYLEPFIAGGPHFLGGKQGLLTPKAVPLNAYGNLSRGKLAALKAKPGVFVGPVTLKDGQVINGVWQRPVPKGANTVRRRGAAAAPGALQGARTLKLLIRFSDPKPVTQHLDFQGRAEAAVRKHFEAEFAKAFAKAMASAK